jgi:predicted  nucleic acid-binding Zn-ribbon protein
MDTLKGERQKLPFKAKRELNSKIQKLKDKQASLEDEISEIRRRSRDDEKAKSKKLQDEG